MKAVLISIKPKWCELIANGKKTVEVRKTMPKLELPFKCYIYCTQAHGKNDYLNLNPFGYDLEGKPISEFTINGNGKVIGEFVCDRITEIHYHDWSGDYGVPMEQFFANIFAESTCLNYEELHKYLQGQNGYGWNISDLVIYDKPKELGEFMAYEKPNCCAYLKGICLKVTRKEFPSCSDMICDYRRLKRPFQSWGYIEDLGV